MTMTLTKQIADQIVKDLGLCEYGFDIWMMCVEQWKGEDGCLKMPMAEYLEYTSLNCHAFTATGYTYKDFAKLYNKKGA